MTESIKKINIFCDGGFANRLNSLLSGLYLSKITKYEPIIFWPSNNWCRASFNDIFLNTNYNVINYELPKVRTIVNKLDDMCIMLHDTIASDNLSVKFNSAYRHNNLNDFLSELETNKNNEIFYFPVIIPTWINNEHIKDSFKLLILNDYITNGVNKFLEQIGEPFYGIHIRNTDLSIGLSQYEILKMLKKYNNKFFLCSDSNETEQKYVDYKNIFTRKKTSYPGKTNSNSGWNDLTYDTANRLYPFNMDRSVESCIEGVIDFIILANSNIIGNSGSTYQFLARLLRLNTNESTDSNKIQDINHIDFNNIMSSIKSNSIDIITFINLMNKYDNEDKIHLYEMSLNFFTENNHIVLYYYLAIEYINIDKNKTIEYLKKSLSYNPNFTQAEELLNMLTKDNISLDNRQKLLVIGWKDINHSFSLVNQFQLLELVKKDNLKVYHQQAPYFHESWSATNNKSGLDEASIKILDSIENYNNQDVDIVLNITPILKLYKNKNVKKIFTFIVFEYELNEDLYKCNGPNFKITEFTENNNWVITPSNWCKQKLINYGLNSEKIIVIPHGIDPQLYYPLSQLERTSTRTNLNISDNDFVFLNVGAPFQNKGTDILIKAFCNVAQTNKNVKLFLKYNKDLYKMPFNMYIQSLNLGDILTPEICSKISIVESTFTLHQLRLLYGAADLYVSSYRGEGFNMPVLEAMACGLNTIVTDGGATDDFSCDGITTKIKSEIKYLNNYITSNYLEPNVVDLTNKMLAVSYDKKNTNSMALYKFIKKFYWDNISNNLYNNLFN